MKGRMSRLACAAFPWVAVVGLLAGNGEGAAGQTLKGRILERDTDRPVQQARLVLFDADGDTLGHALSDRQGRFSISSKEPGDYFLKATAFGYRTTRGGVFELGRGGEMTLEIRMTPDPLSIEGVVVERPWVLQEPPLVRSGILERMALGQGFFLTPYLLEQSPALRLTDVLASVPRLALVHASTDRILVLDKGGYCVPAIIVDGIVASQARGFQGDPNEVRGTEGDLEAVVPLIKDVEAVEVYRGGLEMPGQFAGMIRNECGAIVVWTRRRR